MLANSFMKPEALGITEAETAALIRVLGMLERCELIHRPDNPAQADIPNAFSMGHWGTKADCGTIGCIRGWARFIGGEVLFIGRQSDAVHGLFTVDGDHDVDWCGITTGQSAAALRNFLTTGRARWHEALAA